MTKEELLIRLRELHSAPLQDPEIQHREADLALLEYINDPEVTLVFEAMEKWYA